MRLLAALALGTVAGSLVQGCSTGACKAVSFDLTQPPSREEVGMRPGERFTSVSCDQGFAMTLMLPDKAEIGLTARRVGADSYSSANPKTSPPTTVDVHSAAQDTDEAVRSATALAAKLGIDPGPVQSWRRRVRNTPTDSVDSPFLRNRVGYVSVDMQVQHLGVSGNNYLHLIFTWSRETPDL